MNADDIDVVAIELAEDLRSHDSSVLPLAARPLAKYTMRSMAESNGFMSCAESKTVIWCSAEMRRSKATISAMLRMSNWREARPATRAGTADQGVGDQNPLLLAAG